MKTLNVPQFEELGIKALLKQLNHHPEVWNYLPEARDVKKVPRQWLYDIAYTIIGKPLSDWVDSKIAERNNKLAEKQNLYIKMDPDIAAAFHASQNISSK